MKDSEFITIATFKIEARAQMMCSVLQNGGVEAFVKGGLVSNLLPFVGNIEVVIRREDEARARQIISTEWKEETL